MKIRENNFCVTKAHPSYIKSLKENKVQDWFISYVIVSWKKTKWNLKNDMNNIAVETARVREACQNQLSEATFHIKSTDP